jgi:hypothetical protein
MAMGLWEPPQRAERSNALKAEKQEKQFKKKIAKST